MSGRGNNRGELPITREEFRELCEDAFLRSAWEGTEERAKAYLKTEEAEGYVNTAYDDFAALWKDGESYQRKCGHLTFEAACKAEASAVGYNMMMSY